MPNPEGCTRNAGKHAGGVVISPTTITDFAPIYADSEGNFPVTQFDKNDVETAGLVKFDFLGLGTLTIIDWALGWLTLEWEKQIRHQSHRVDPLDDPASFRSVANQKPPLYSSLNLAVWKIWSNVFSQTVSKTSSHWWHCSVRGRCNQAW